MASASARFNGSPATFTTCTVGGTTCSSISVFITDGTVLISVTSVPPLARSNALDTTRMLAPVVSGTKHSYTARSKFNDVENNVRARTSPLKNRCAQQIRLTVLRCSSITPLGTPDPAAHTRLPLSALPAAPRSSQFRAPGRCPPARPASLPGRADNVPTDLPAGSTPHSSGSGLGTSPPPLSASASPAPQTA